MSLREKAKSLRVHQTNAEARLWHFLRAHRFCDLKFKRQYPLGRYIVDFVCLEKWLIIEVDGGQHVDQADDDKTRDCWLTAQGFQVLRFWNHEVLGNTHLVLEHIHRHVDVSPNALSPSPSPASGRGETTREPQA